MIFTYECDDCGMIERDYDIGKAATFVKCPCGKKAKKIITGGVVIFKGGGWHSNTRTLNKEMTKRNEKAGRRMRVEHDAPPKLIDQR